MKTYLELAQLDYELLLKLEPLNKFVQHKAFMCQQICEKYLKHLICKMTSEAEMLASGYNEPGGVLKTHSLTKLNTALFMKTGLAVFKPRDLEVITQMYMSRYPDSYVAITGTEYERIRQVTEEVVIYCELYLGLARRSLQKSNIKIVEDFKSSIPTKSMEGCRSNLDVMKKYIEFLKIKYEN